MWTFGFDVLILFIFILSFKDSCACRFLHDNLFHNYKDQKPSFLNRNINVFLHVRPFRVIFFSHWSLTGLKTEPIVTVFLFGCSLFCVKDGLGSQNEQQVTLWRRLFQTFSASCFIFLPTEGLNVRCFMFHRTSFNKLQICIFADENSSLVSLNAPRSVKVAIC